MCERDFFNPMSTQSLALCRSLLKNHSCVIDCHGFNCKREKKIKKCTADFTPQRNPLNTFYFNAIVQCQEWLEKKELSGWCDSGNKGNDTMSSNRGLYEMRHPYSHTFALY